MTDIHQLGLQVQFIVWPIIFYISLAVSILFFLLWIVAVIKLDYDHPVKYVTGIPAWIGVATLIICAIGWPLSAIPENPKYWSYYSVTGTVDGISNGFDNGGGDATYRVYIVKFKGDERPYEFTDARVITLKDQKIEALCTIDWVDYGNSVDQWNCSIRSADYGTAG